MWGKMRMTPEEHPKYSSIMFHIVPIILGLKLEKSHIESYLMISSLGHLPDSSSSLWTFWLSIA